MVVAAGSFLGMVTNIHWASAGRALIGLGVGCLDVIALKAISQIVILFAHT